ncbi:ABCtype anion transport system duplicated permease component CDS [Bradyrhizobium sp.]|uniref:ABC transporter permease n=1 Tax=Bradyrhizobium sp. TaxID=376 RepID=UPI0007C1A031|nr:ABC transporter permease subunit [Bradyrhizobium sp.]CUU14896.1 ABCtype anion transport system duplicated permease component CDS [Bradyrhizobium sp.]
MKPRDIRTAAIGRALLPNVWDVAALILVIGAMVLIVYGGEQTTAPLSELERAPVTLDPANLPLYALRTVLRMLLAIVCSTVFTFIYAAIAAKSRRAELVMIPLLDILQSVPILGFLTFTVVFFMNLFPGQVLGAELASVFAIFTSQAWNMTFSLYQSIRNVPKDLEEATQSFHLSGWQRFWRLDVPFAMPGLIWNAMMSMSGASGEAPASWMLDLFRRTRALRALTLPFAALNRAISNLRIPLPKLPPAAPGKDQTSRLVDTVWIALILAGTAYAAWLTYRYLSASLGMSDVLVVIRDGLITLLRVAILISLATLIWVPVGVWIGLRPKLAERIQPLAQFLAAFPANLAFPVFVVAIVSFHLGGWRWWFKVILPGVFPYYITGAITASGGSWNASIVAEVASWGDTHLKATGLGAYIASATEAGDFPRVVLGIATMCILVTLFNRLVWRPLYAFGERRLRLG